MSGMTFDNPIDVARHFQDLYVEWRARAEKAEADYAFMVKRAMDGTDGRPGLDGYRELAARCAQAESDVAALRVKMAKYRAEIDRLQGVYPQEREDCPECGIPLSPSEMDSRDMADEHGHCWSCQDEYGGPSDDDDDEDPF